MDRFALRDPYNAAPVSAETVIIVIVFALWLLTFLHGLYALWEGVRFSRHVDRMIAFAAAARDESGRFRYQPPAVIILPCCGVDEKLHHTVAGLARQSYEDYEIIFTFESADDPAYAAVCQWTTGNYGPRCQRVVAGPTQHRSQKVHNLLAAVERIGPDRDLIVFLDSDAEPGPDWLGHLAAPLQDPSVGAATGYRWYCAMGGLASGLRCAWNAATVNLLDHDFRNFCWGGATAIRRETFDRLNIAGRWERALSDDYQMTRGVREAGLAIRFVPQALVASRDTTTFRQFWAFARRQLIITRICGPELWWAALFLCVNFVVGGTAVATLFFAAAFGWIGDARLMAWALAAWMSVLALAGAKAVLRQLALHKVLSPAVLGWRDTWWDVTGAPLSGLFHLSLMLAATGTREVTWRNRRYEMISPDETRVIE